MHTQKIPRRESLNNMASSNNQDAQIKLFKGISNGTSIKQTTVKKPFVDKDKTAVSFFSRHS